MLRPKVAMTPLLLSALQLQLTSWRKQARVTTPNRQCVNRRVGKADGEGKWWRAQQREPHQKADAHLRLDNKQSHALYNAIEAETNEGSEVARKLDKLSW